MKKSSANVRLSLIFLIFSIFIFVPILTYGQKNPLPTHGIVPACTGDRASGSIPRPGDADFIGPTTPGASSPECGWQDLLKLVNNLITYLLYASIAVATFTFGFSGFNYTMSGGNPSKAESAKKMFGKTFWGLFYVFLGWLIIEALLTGIGLQDGYSILIK